MSMYCLFLIEILTNYLPIFCLQDNEKGKKMSWGYVPLTHGMDKVFGYKIPYKCL
jgi:hypothetical protein